jgi:two-component system cell cycle sensor histidine kinase/response regulator CckA
MNSQGKSIKKLVNELEGLRGRLKNLEHIIEEQEDDGSTNNEESVILDLSRSGVSYQNVIENMPFGVLMLDSEGFIIYVNKKAYEILSLPTDVIDKNSKISTIAPFKEYSVKRYFENLIKRSSAFDFESPFIIKAINKKIHLRCRGIPFWSSINEPLMFEIIIEEISKPKQIDELFRQSQQLEAVGKLAGGIAHDFNNILTIIHGSNELLMSNFDQSNPLYEHMKQIERASVRAESLTRQLLAFSRKQLLQPKVFNPNDLIKKMEERLEQHLGTKIELKTILKRNIGHIEADANQIEQVIMNLVINARDAMPKGGDLIIETKNVVLDDKYVKTHPVVEAGPYVMLAITDSGFGIEKSIQTQIFEPFFTTKDKGKGAGMGLATVYGIIKQSGGFIWVYSEKEKGTVFKIYLPRVDEISEPVEEKVVSDNRLKGKETILVVDDEEEVRTLVSEMLRFYEYKVLEAPNASNALHIFEKYSESIDLILTDVVMPQINGPELVEQILPSYPEIKILFMSGYTDVAIVEKGLLDKERNYIQKPFSAADLVGKVRNLLNSETIPD